MCVHVELTMEMFPLHFLKSFSKNFLFFQNSQEKKNLKVFSASFFLCNFVITLNCNVIGFIKYFLK